MDENSVKRVVPQSKDAEQAVIGCMLMHREIIRDVAGIITKEDFYNPRYGIIFQAMVELYDEGMAADILTVTERLKKNEVPEEVANANMIIEIMDNTPVSANATDYARIIQEKSILRNVIGVCNDISKECYLSKENVDFILEQAEDKLFKISQARSGKTDYADIKDVVVEVVHDIEVAASNNGDITGISSGFRRLDEKLNGLHSGELLLVAARPAMGKTAFVLNIVHSLSVRDKIPTAFFTLEMPASQLVSRMIAIDACLDSKAIKIGDLNDEEWQRMMVSSEEIAKAPLYIVDNSDLTLGDFKSICRKLKREKDVQLIAIDYLQLMSASKPTESRQLFIAEVARAMKNIARELEIPVIALSQLSRSVDSRPDHKPVLSDLRESGAIEQDADVVMFIYRDEYYNPDDTEKPNTAEIIIAKQRNGEVGSVDLRWIGKYTKFADPERTYTSENI